MDKLVDYKKYYDIFANEEIPNLQQMKDELRKFADVIEQAAYERWNMSLVPQLRKLSFRYVSDAANRPAGDSNTTTQGLILFGDRVPNLSNTQALVHRAKLMQVYNSTALASINQYLENRKFKKAPNNNYDDPEQAFLAVELSEAAKKGPYDNGNKETIDNSMMAIISAESEHLNTIPIKEGAIQAYVDDYKTDVTRINGSMVWTNVIDYPKVMQNNGLLSTFRGFPFFKSGDALVDFKDLATLAWLFKGTNTSVVQLIKTLQDDVVNYNESKNKFLVKGKLRDGDKQVITYFHKELLRPINHSYLTVDQVTAMILDSLLRNEGNFDVLLNVKFNVNLTISRDQGSPYEVGSEDAKFYKLIAKLDRKARKFRPVVPAPAFAQAISMCYMHSYVDAAPTLNHRVGLEAPEVNVRRMSEKLSEVYSNGLFYIGIDFSRYDSTVHRNMQSFIVSLYKDVFPFFAEKDSVFSVIEHSLINKIFVYPKLTDQAKTLYSNQRIESVLLKKIKGDRNYLRRSYKQLLSQSELDTIYSKSKNEEVDFSVWASLIISRYLISGHLLTNTLGSDMTKMYCVAILYEFYLANYITLDEFKRCVHTIITSGDDALVALPQSILEVLSYQQVLELFQKYAHDLGMEINASKQIDILYKGLPMVEFLNMVYLPQPGDGIPYKKFIRQWMAAPYSERYAKLPPVPNLVSTIGKIESGLCVQNLDMAAHLLHRQGILLHEYYRKNNIKPQPQAYITDRKKAIPIAPMHPYNSTYLGMDLLVNLTQTYGQDVVSQLGKIAANTLDVSHLADFLLGEFEGRAPHKKPFINALLAKLDSKTASEKYGNWIDTKSSNVHWYIVDLINHWVALNNGKTPSLRVEEITDEMKDGIVGVVPEDELDYIYSV